MGPIVGVHGLNVTDRLYYSRIVLKRTQNESTNFPAFGHAPLTVRYVFD